MCNPCLFAFLPTYHFPSTKIGNPHFYLNRFNIKIARNGFIGRQSLLNIGKIQIVPFGRGVFPQVFSQSPNLLIGQFLGKF